MLSRRWVRWLLIVVGLISGSLPRFCSGSWCGVVRVRGSAPFGASWCSCGAGGGDDCCRCEGEVGWGRVCACVRPAQDGAVGGWAPVGALSSKGTQARVRRVVPVLFVGAYFGGSRAVGEGDGDCLARGVGCLYRESSGCYGNTLVGRYPGCLGSWGGRRSLPGWRRLRLPVGRSSGPWVDEGALRGVRPVRRFGVVLHKRPV